MIYLEDGSKQQYRLESDLFGGAILRPSEEEQENASYIIIDPDDDDWHKYTRGMDPMEVLLRGERTTIAIESKIEEAFYEMADADTEKDLGPVILTAYDPSEEDMNVASNVGFKEISLYDFRYKNGSWSVVIREGSPREGNFSHLSFSISKTAYLDADSDVLLAVNHFGRVFNQKVVRVAAHTYEKLAAVMQATTTVVMAIPGSNASGKPSSAG